MNTELLTNTIAFIRDAHQGQMYGNRPYYLHPLEVAATLVDPTEDEFIAALLHDVVEDTDWTLDGLLGEGFSYDIVSIVGLLTKDDDLTYEQNIQRIIDSKNVSAMKVKLADNTVNSASHNTTGDTERDERILIKCSKSMQRLNEALTR